MSERVHNCLHCGREVQWTGEKWVDAYGNIQCPRGPLHEYNGRTFRGSHGAPLPVDKYPKGRPRE